MSRAQEASSLSATGSSWIRSPEAALIVTAFVLPVLSMLGGRLIAQVFIPLALWHILRNAKRLKPFPAFLRHPLVWLLGGGILWGWISLGWSIAPEDSLSTLTRVGSLILAGMVMLYLILRQPPTAEAAQRIAKSLLWGMGLAAGFAVSAIAFDGGIPALLNHAFSTGRAFDMYLLKQGNLVLAMLIWPLVIALLLAGKRLHAHLALIVLLVIMAFMPSYTAFYSLLGSYAVFLLYCFFSRGQRLWLTVSGLAAIWLTLLLILPNIQLATLQTEIPWMRHSMLHRLYVWQFTDARIADEPVTGWGIKSSKVIPGALEKIPGHKTWDHMPLHPHNNLLQIWLELGVPGLLSYLGLVALSLRGIHRMKLEDPRVHAACYAALLCAILGGMTGFGLWQSWWVNANMLFAALLLALILPRLNSKERLG